MYCIILSGSLQLILSTKINTDNYTQTAAKPEVLCVFLFNPKVSVLCIWKAFLTRWLTHEKSTCQ
jgi:hypothetical protein